MYSRDREEAEVKVAEEVEEEEEEGKAEEGVEVVQTGRQKKMGRESWRCKRREGFGQRSYLSH